MKTLKNCIKLSSQVKIYVPSTMNVSQKFDTREFVDQALQLLSDSFGGATASPALGAWIANDMKLVKENVTVVFAYCDGLALQVHIDKIYNFCLTMKDQLKQEAIALEVNGELYLI